MPAPFRRVLDCLFQPKTFSVVTLLPLVRLEWSEKLKEKRFQKGLTGKNGGIKKRRTMERFLDPKNDLAFKR
jgi:hypothetical protein